jgi:hypothetical protein
MGALDVLSRKSGVIVGDDVLKLFNYAQEKNFAIPAIVGLCCPTFLEIMLAYQMNWAPMKECYLVVNRCCSA